MVERVGLFQRFLNEADNEDEGENTKTKSAGWCYGCRNILKEMVSQGPSLYLCIHV